MSADEAWLLVYQEARANSGPEKDPLWLEPILVYIVVPPLG
jgi:hypothetical protein